MWREGRETVVLALPLIAGQLSQMLMGVVDTLMIGRVGVTELAASSFANTLIYLPFVVGIGMSIAVSIRVSQARGAGDPAAARAALRHGIQIALALGLLAFGLAWLAVPWLGVFRQPPEVLAAAPDYFLLLAASLIPAMAGMAVKSHADAMNRPWPVFWITLGSVLLNAALNWLLIFGKAGLPALGLVGAGWATLIARSTAFVAMIVWCLRSRGLREWVPYHWFRAPDRAAVARLLGIGLPSSLQLLAEISAFVAATILIGTLGEAALASHQVAISCAATVFMIPLGLSMALTVRIGAVWGAGETTRMRAILVSGWLLGSLVALLGAAAFLGYPKTIAGWFLEPGPARDVTAALLGIAAVFQLSDALQILSSGVLRGFDDVRVPAWISFGAYWVISIPLGWVLAFPGGRGVEGMWWGITLGLTLTALALGRRAWRMTGPLRRTTGSP